LLNLQNIFRASISQLETRSPGSKWGRGPQPSYLSMNHYGDGDISRCIVTVNQLISICHFLGHFPAVAIAHLHSTAE